MSQLLQVATRAGGNIPVTDGVLAPADFDQGIPYEADGSLAVDDLGVIDHHWQGLPFTAIGRLAVALNGVVDTYGAGAMPLNTAGQLVTGAGAIDHYSAGIPYHSGGGISVV